MLGRRDIELLADGVERDGREVAGVLAHPGILARRRQAAHQHNLELCVVVGIIVQRGVWIAGVHKPAMGRGERARLRQAAKLDAVLPKELDPIEQLALVGADPPAHIGLGQHRHVVEPRDLACGHHPPRRVGPVEEPQRQPVVADQLGDLLAIGEWNAAVLRGIAPEQRARQPSPLRAWRGELMRPWPSISVQIGLAMSCSRAAVNSTARAVGGSACQAGSAASASATMRVWISTSPSAW